MKLKHILPIASLTGIAAVAMPIATSCAGEKGDWTLTHDFIKKGEYEATVPQKEGQAMDDTNANKAYFDDIAKNNEIFGDDYAEAKANTIYGDYQLTAPDKLNQFKFNFKFIGVDADKKTLSYKFNYEIGGIHDSKTFKSSINVELINIPHSLSWWPGAGEGWRLNSLVTNISTLTEFENVMSGIENWTINVHLSMVNDPSDGDVDKTINYSQSKKPSTDENVKEMNSLIYWLELIKPHYMQKIGHQG